MSTKVYLPKNEFKPLSVFSKNDIIAHTSWSLNFCRPLCCIEELKIKYNITGKGIKVAVLDTGVNTKHENLDVVGSRNFTVLSSLSTSTKVDVDKDDKTATKSSTLSFDESNDKVEDLVGHGSHCAGIICGKGRNNVNVGIAQDALLYVAKVLDDEGEGYIEWITQGILWAIEEKVDIINMSLGSNGKICRSFAAVIEKAIKAGIIICVAAGNSGPYPSTVECPGNFNLCLTVGAIKNNNSIASFSSRGDAVDIVAPGVNILSCYTGAPNMYAYLSGTSMATPFVSGVCALILEYARREKPSLKINQIMMEKLLKESALDLGPAGFDIHYGSGRIHLEAVLKKIDEMVTI